MEIKINHNLLSDSPFDKSNEELFEVLHPETADLIEDITNGNPTCYLISGYRGSGKSSFIRRVEKEIKEKNKTDANQEKREVVFVHTNFSKYHNQTFLLRKLIRGLYLEIKEFNSYSKLKENQRKLSQEERYCNRLEKLYEKTFYDTSDSFNRSKTREKILVFNLDIKEVIKLVTPLLFAIFFGLNLRYDWVSQGTLLNVIGLLGAAFLSVLGTFTLTKSIQKSRTSHKDFNRKSLYDDDIADYHFFSVLKSLQTKYKIVFVLDELDKVDDCDIDNLLKEMKPYLVSGQAGFIAVAGQNLFYKYIHAKSIDDNVLSSIFSKFIHVPLFTREEFRSLFMRLVDEKFQPTNEQKEHLNAYVDFLVFESKRVPRKFISLLRQALKWKDGSSFLEIEQSYEQLKKFSTILNILDRITDEEIDTEGFEHGIRDYFIMQLLIRSHKILFSKKLTFTRSEIITHNG